MKQLLKENSKWKNVGWFFRILFMIFALTPGCLTTLSDGLDGLHVEMVFLTMGVGAVCWITKDESLRKTDGCMFCVPFCIYYSNGDKLS